MTMKFCRFRDFAVPLLGLSTCHPSIHEMPATLLVDSSFRAPHLTDAAGTRLCLGRTLLRFIRDRFVRPAPLSPRFASTIQIVRPWESIAETQPQLQPALLRFR